MDSVIETCTTQCHITVRQLLREKQYNFQSLFFFSGINHAKVKGIIVLLYQIAGC